jgi:hypothetical protein
MAADVERLKSLIHLADLIGETFPLTGSGRYRKTKEHDSLVVDTLKEEYWWNSHNEHGDAIDWTGRHRLNFAGAWNSHDPAMFKESVTWLARWAGQPEPEFRPEDPQAREQRLSRERLLALAADYYHELFLASQDAQDYAVNRGWSLETIKRARLGYSDGKLIEAIPQADHVLARDIGLLAEKDGRWFDAIPANCLVYVHLVRGKVGYLSGRSLQGKRHHNLYAPKELYWAIPQGFGGPLAIVEGQPDAISIAQWGVASLGLCGVNLEGIDPDIVGLFSPVYLALDHDRAGAESLDRLVYGLRDPLVRIVEWPEVFLLSDQKLAKDANDLLRAGATSSNFQAWLKTADTYLNILIEKAKSLKGADRDPLIQQIFDLLVMLDPFPLTRYRARACNELGFSRYDFDRLLAIAKNEDDQYNGFSRGEQYVITPDGWTIIKLHDETGRVRPAPLVNAIIRITELLELDNGSGELYNMYQIEGDLCTGKPLPTIQVPTSDFEAMKWTYQHWPEVIVDPGRITKDRLRAAIQHLSGEIPRHRIYEHTGWREINGHKVYLTPTGALGLGDDPEFTVEVDLRMGRPDTNMQRYSLPLQPQDIDSAILASLNFWDITDPTVTIPQWAAVYLAPLAPFLTADFGLWMHGKSGSFKSVLAALALCHFGDWTGRDGRLKSPSSFGSTANNILMNAFQAKDILLLIDDYAPGNTPREIRERDEVASRLLRSLGNKAARGRMQDGRRYQPDFPPRCLALITAEDVPSGQSVLARGIGVRVYTPPKGTTEREAIEARITQAQNVDAHLYPHAMAAYILWIQRHWNELSEQLPVNAEQHTKEIIASGHSRLVDAFGKLTAAIDTALFFFQDAGVLSERQARERQRIATIALQKVIAEHAGQIESLDPCLILAETIQEQVDGEDWYLDPFAPLIDPEGREYTPSHPMNAKLIGWEDDEYVYLLTKTVKLVMDLYNRLGTPFPIGRNTLYARLEERGWLVPDPQRGANSIIHIPSANGSKGVLKLRRDAIFPSFREDGKEVLPLDL